MDKISNNNINFIISSKKSVSNFITTIYTTENCLSYVYMLLSVLANHM